MKKIILITGMLMALGSAAHAHHRSVVTIEKADKVFVKAGVSERKVMAMLGCLLKLKKFENAEAAVDAKMAMIKEKCTKHSLNDEKCQKMQSVAAMKIHKCFAKQEFIKEFFKVGKTE